jgi:hypothetical protein
MAISFINCGGFALDGLACPTTSINNKLSPKLKGRNTKTIAMTGSTKQSDDSDDEAARRLTLSPAARRALEEADARREAEEGAARDGEINGPKGPEPTRYGDWERKGIAYDF